MDPKISLSQDESMASPEQDNSRPLIDLAHFNELEAYVDSWIEYKEVSVTHLYLALLPSIRCSITYSMKIENIQIFCKLKMYYSSFPPFSEDLF